MKNFDKATDNEDTAHMYKLFKDCNMLDLISNISLGKDTFEREKKQGYILFHCNT